MTGQAGLFPALLKHWRHRRGLSQLDLALAADVSSRHVSFLETGRSVPSAEMILRLSAALDVPLRQVNALLRAAGQDPVYPEPGPGRALTPDVARALEMLKNNQEPFPLVVIDRAYEVVDVNRGALRLFAGLMPGLTQEGVRGLNLLRATFAPGGVRDAIVNQDEVGRALLWRVQREVLADRDG
ncbi:MAG: helix-turn-helix domain-containing protein, partial [Myxococcota bacterium]